MSTEFKAVNEFPDWYTTYRVDPREGHLVVNGLAPCAQRKIRQYQAYKSEHQRRVHVYEMYEKQAAAEVVTKKADLPNISSGESAGMIRRIARNVVQHTPNVFIANEFDDDSVQGVVADYLLTTKVIGDELYSNDMQQNLATTARRAFTIGFDCVVPLLLQDAQKKWYIQYDNIHYRDVFPEPGCKDIRRAKEIFVRRYLTKAEINQLIEDNDPSWDIAALRSLRKTAPMMREWVDHENKKHSVNSEAYEIITWYSATGQSFLTFAGSMNFLLRIERNKHPLKEHPVFFYIPERDDAQPFGKSLLSLTFGRQEYQDLFMNGAMKMFARNINPPIIGYGTINAIPNLSPGKYTQIQNPNAKIEAFEINSQALMMFGQISQQNQANMVQMLGAADQQMAAQGTNGMMSQTPQGVEAQQQMVDITTNNYQKAMEQFFSKYCSYALTIYFQELKGTKSVLPSADTRKKMINAGIKPEAFIHEAYVAADGTEVPADGSGLKDGELEADFASMATLYYVQCVPGSLVELEDEKQARQIKEMFVPLSQMMPALAQTGDPESLKRAANVLDYMLRRTIELSGSVHSAEINAIFEGTQNPDGDLMSRTERMEQVLGGVTSEFSETTTAVLTMLQTQQDQISVLNQGLSALLTAQGVPASGGQTDTPAPVGPVSGPPATPALTP